jgi:hypothetical protein
MLLNLPADDEQPGSQEKAVNQFAAAFQFHGRLGLGLI